MKCLITGVAGFIGSALGEKLVSLGNEVVGIDSFTDYYPRKLKDNNIRSLMADKNFTLIEGNLINADLKKLLKGTDVVFHQAAQAGVRASWGEKFKVYVDNNVLATQLLLEAAKDSNIKKLIFASSSSVYGDTKDIPMKESSETKPISPYGVTKLAAEHLCYLYWKTYGVPTASLRYFTVYGPRQRPDMAFNKFIKAMLKDEEIVIFGDGEQTRDFTFISDAVSANLLLAESKAVGEVFNIGGGSNVSVKQVIKMLEKIAGKKPKLKFVEKQKGDMRNTVADISKAKKTLGYAPSVKLEEGLEREFNWVKETIKL
jgi:UDP-glucose 4-epimerase